MLNSGPTNNLSQRRFDKYFEQKAMGLCQFDEHQATKIKGCRKEIDSRLFILDLNASISGRYFDAMNGFFHHSKMLTY